MRRLRLVVSQRSTLREVSLLYRMPFCRKRRACRHSEFNDCFYGNHKEMTAAGSDTFSWDHFGNMKTKVSGGNTTTFGWSFESGLLSIDYPGTSNDDTHEYDGDHRRMRSKLAGAANWTNFVWDEPTQELLAEYTLISGTFTIKALNTYGLGLISSNREGTKRYFHFDGLGNTAALDDESETLKDSYTYESFGVVVTATSTNGPSVNPFRFVGQWGYYDDGAVGSQQSLISWKQVAYSPEHAVSLSAAFVDWPHILPRAPSIQQLLIPGCSRWEEYHCKAVCWSKGQGYLGCIPGGRIGYICVCFRRPKGGPRPLPWWSPKRWSYEGCYAACMTACNVLGIFFPAFDTSVCDNQCNTICTSWAGINPKVELPPRSTR